MPLLIRQNQFDGSDLAAVTIRKLETGDEINNFVHRFNYVAINVYSSLLRPLGMVWSWAMIFFDGVRQQFDCVCVSTFLA